MKVVDYTCEQIGYFSQVLGFPDLRDPVFRRLNIEELKKINGTGGFQKTAFDCNKQVDDSGGVSSTKRLGSNFEKKNASGQISSDFNVYCNGNVLTNIYMPPETIDLGKKPTIFSVLQEERNTFLGAIEGNESAQGSSKPSRQPSQHNLQSVNAGMYADVHLTKLLDETLEQEKNFGESNLFITVKHCFKYTDGTVVNLFVSNEINAVQFNDDYTEAVSIDLKYYTHGNVEAYEFRSRKQMLIDFLADGVCFITGIMLEDKKIVKVTVSDCLGSICSKVFMDSFKQKLGDLLHALVSSDGNIVKIEVNSPDILLISEAGNRLLSKRLHSQLRKVDYLRKVDLLRTIVFRKAPEFKYDPKETHTLLIVGSIPSPINMDTHHLIYHIDVVSIDMFCGKLFSSFMCEPQDVLVYGKKEELEKVKKAMTKKERDMAEFIKVE